MGSAKYRPAIKIVLKLLECISKNQLKGRALKTHIIQCANLKTTSAEKYINMLKEAGYVEEKRLDWGGTRGHYLRAHAPGQIKIRLV